MSAQQDLEPAAQPASEPVLLVRVAPSDRPRADRRAFLTWLTRGSLAAVLALAIGQTARFIAFEPAGQALALIPIGKPGDYAGGTLTYAAPARAYIGRDAGGMYAIDAVCTHLGCLVEQPAGGGFTCPCHGSRFGADGGLQGGPAGRALSHLGLQLDQAGQVLIERSQQVAPTTRLVIPA